MLRDRIDEGRLRHDIATGAASCAEIKRALRATWTRPMADEQRRLCRARRRLTDLLVLLARSRGRYHLAKPPGDLAAAGVAWDREAWHARVAERVLLDYPRQPEREVCP